MKQIKRMERVKEKRQVPIRQIGMLLSVCMLPILYLFLLPYGRTIMINPSSVEEKQKLDIDVENNIKGMVNSSTNPFQIQPQCSILKRLLDNMEETNTEITIDDLTMDRIFGKFGKYVNASNPTPRYDHTTCFFMKPRYNCGNDLESSKNETKATDYALALVQEDEICDLQQFIADAGGVAGVGRRILENFQQKRHKVDPDPDKPKIIKVVIAGISLHRQVFEALSCGFRDTLSDFKVLRNEDKKGKKIVRHLVKYNFDNFQTKKGICYNPKEKQEQFYGYVLEAPKNHVKCTDDLGIAEFRLENNNKIRFYYLYRPWRLWENDLNPVFDAMGLGDTKDHPDRKIDFLFTDGGNSYETKVKKWSDASILYDYFQIRNTTIRSNNNNNKNKNNNNATNITMTIPNHLFQNVSVGAKKPPFLDQYRILQLEDLGQWFGAKNSRNPDGDENHGCMPGPPDDKVNFLLWYMLSLSEL